MISHLLYLSVLFGSSELQASPSSSEPPSTAFYYGQSLPAMALAQFDQVVVQADQAEAAGVALLTSRGSTVFAYVSLSEVSRERAKSLDPRWRLGDNQAWQSVIMDTTQPDYQRWLLTSCFQPLWERGFRAFFLDNLDSYQAPLSDPNLRAAQVRGLVQIITELHGRFPGVKLLFNRGFELLPQVAPLAVGVVAESLFQGWDPVKKIYREVPSNDRNGLLTALRNVRERYHLPVVVIDYVPQTDHALRQNTARRIAALGLTPWVTEHTLASLGIGSVEPIPRRILALYNGGDQRHLGTETDVAHAAIHLTGAVVLEHLGYAIDYHDVREPLPTGILRDKYAGIVTWFTDEQVPNQVAFQAWLLAQVNAGMKVAMLDHLGFFPNQATQQQLGFRREDRRSTEAIKLREFDPSLVGFESPVEARQHEFYPLRVEGVTARRVLSVEDTRGTRMDAVFLSWWGGVAVSPYLQSQGPLYEYRWIVNPFAFLTQALQLQELPAPDVTTLDGHRILVVHIDGDGFPSRALMPGNAYSGKVILKEILKRYPVKTTVSIIEGEIGSAGKWPKLSPQLEPIAREIFALPNVEVASHSYSHPFNWLSNGKDLDDGTINGLFHYRYSLEREIAGSIAYINNRLAPKNKPVKVFLWSGEAVAPVKALSLVKEAGVLSMNGGNTIISSRRPTLTAVSPMGRQVGEYYQTYAPIQNEMPFTNEWRGPYYGFRDVISSFQLTEKPRRLKPINIYYHFYSGSKIGSLKVLRQIYEWALSQDVVSVFGSEYIRKVEDFQQLSLARRLDGCWQIRSGGALTTLRLDASSAMGRLDSSRSKGVLSARDLPQGRYISLDGSGRSVVCLRPTASASSSMARKEIRDAQSP